MWAMLCTSAMLCISAMGNAQCEGLAKYKDSKQPLILAVLFSELEQF